MGSRTAILATASLVLCALSPRAGFPGFVSRPSAPTSGVVSGVVLEVDGEACAFQFRDDTGDIYRVAYEESTVFAGPRADGATPLLRGGARVSVKYSREVDELGARQRGHCPIRYLATFVEIEGPVALASSPVP